MSRSAFEIDMPDCEKGATPGHLYKWIYNGGAYGKKPSMNDLVDKGWGELFYRGLIYWNTTLDQLRVRDDLMPEIYRSEAIENYNAHETMLLRDLPDLARIKGIGGLPRTVMYSQKKGPRVTGTIGAAGAIAAALVLVDASAYTTTDGDKIYLEEIEVSVDSAFDWSGTAGPANALLVIQNTTPAELFACTIHQGESRRIKCRCDLGLAYATGTPAQADIQLNITTGLAPLANGDLVHVTPYFRVI